MIKNLVKNLYSQDWIKHLIRAGTVYIVGGSVRDALMNKSPKDIDIVVEGLGIDDVKEMLKHFGKTSLVGQSFSVIKFRPKYHKGEDFDIAVPRIDRKIGTGHKGFEVSTEGVTIKEDLKRRDFTINSIAVNIKTGEVLDPFGGRKDIQAKLLRATDKNAFVEDPLRIMRAINFAARFRFDIEPETLNLMKKYSKLLKEISGERILEEFEKILHKGGSTRVAYDLIEKSDIDMALFGQKISKNGFEYFDELDPVSFYFVLGNLANKSPAKFYRERLKGEAHMIKALEILEKYFSKIDSSKPEQENRWNVFLMLKAAPILKDVDVLPKEAVKIIEMMKAKKIPMKLGMIPVNGNDLKELLSIDGTEVGDAIYSMYRAALMNKFNWKSREDTIKYLNNIRDEKIS